MSLLKPKGNNLFQLSLPLVFLVAISVTTTGGTIFVISYALDVGLASLLAGIFALGCWSMLFFLYLRIHYSKFLLMDGYND